MYSKLGCAFCSRAKALLAGEGLPHKTVLLNGPDQTDHRLGQTLSAHTGHYTVPQVS